MLPYWINVGRRVSTCMWLTDRKRACDRVLEFAECAGAVRARWFIVGIAVVAAAAFALSVQAGRWWTVAGFEIGPVGSHRCFDGECTSTGLGWTGGSERWMRTGTGVWAAGFLSMLVLLVVAGAVAGKRVPRLAAKMALVSVATAVVTGALFVIQFPGVQGAEVEIGRGLPLFGAAIVLGATACIAVLRARESKPANRATRRAEG
jgi:hypothetical protein